VFPIIIWSAAIGQREMARDCRDFAIAIWRTVHDQAIRQRFSRSALDPARTPGRRSMTGLLPGAVNERWRARSGCASESVPPGGGGVAERAGDDRSDRADRAVNGQAEASRLRAS
jgi:hypothetical protein